MTKYTIVFVVNGRLFLRTRESVSPAQAARAAINEVCNDQNWNESHYDVDHCVVFAGATLPLAIDFAKGPE